MRELITAQNIADARRIGQREIVVASDALITPQAKDDANLYGITIKFCEERDALQPMSIQSTHYAQNPAPCYGLHHGQEMVKHNYVQGYRPLYAPNPLPRLAPLQENRYLMNMNNTNNGIAPSWASTGSNAPTGSSVNVADIASQVAMQLQKLLGNSSNLQNTVSQVVAEVLGNATPQQATNVNLITGVDVIPFSATCQKVSVQGEVSVEEVLLADANGPGVTRFSFANTALEWTFVHDEVLVVTKGNLDLCQGNARISLATGGSVRIRKGTSLSLIAQGEVCCLSSSWPA